MQNQSSVYSERQFIFNRAHFEKHKAKQGKVVLHSKSLICRINCYVYRALIVLLAYASNYNRCLKSSAKNKLEY